MRSAASGGGGFAATVGQYITQRVNYQSVPASSYTRINWTYDSGAALLDLTTPDRPTVLADGTYLVTVTLECNTNVASGTWYGSLELDKTGADYFAAQTGDLDTFPVAGVTPLLSVALMAPLTAGRRLEVTVAHDAAANRSIGITDGVVTRLA